MLQKAVVKTVNEISFRQDIWCKVLFKENVKLETITDSFKLPNKLIHVFIIKKGNVKVLIFCEDSENLWCHILQSIWQIILKVLRKNCFNGNWRCYHIIKLIPQYVFGRNIFLILLQEKHVFGKCLVNFIMNKNHLIWPIITAQKFCKQATIHVYRQIQLTIAKYRKISMSWNLILTSSIGRYLNIQIFGIWYCLFKLSCINSPLVQTKNNGWSQSVSHIIDGEWVCCFTLSLS